MKGLKTPGGVAVDAGFVYAAETAWQGRVLKAPKAGGGDRGNFANGSTPPDRGARRRAPTVYWINRLLLGDGEVMTAPKAGGAPSVLAGKLRRPRGLAPDRATSTGSRAASSSLPAIATASCAWPNPAAPPRRLQRPLRRRPMSLPVHWVESLAGVGPGDLVEVEGDEAHHAVAVRRLRTGEPLALTDGAGTTVTGVVRATGKRRLTVEVEGSRPRPSPSPGSRSCRPCPRATAASSRSRSSPRSASRPSSRGPPPGRWPSGVANGPRSRWPAGAPRRVRPRSSHDGRGSPASSRWPRPSRSCTLVGGADLAVVLHEDASAALASLAVPAHGLGRRGGRARGRADRRRGRRVHGRRRTRRTPG